MKKSSILALVLTAFLTSACDEDLNGIVGANPAPTLPPGLQNHQSALESFLHNSSKPAVIKFYATWCSSCKDYNPAYNAIKNTMSSEIDFYEVDIDQKANKKLIRDLRISRIPETIFVSKNRKNISRKLGALSESQLKQLINLKLLNK